MLAVWSLVPLPFLKPAWTCGSSWFTYCWRLALRILSITLVACEMSAIPFFGIGMKTDLFQSRGHCSVFQICWHIEYSTLTASSFRFYPTCSCPSLHDPVHCSPPGPSVPGIFWARILKWIAISSPRGSSRLRDQTHVSCIDRWILYHCTTCCC